MSSPPTVIPLPRARTSRSGSRGSNQSGTAKSSRAKSGTAKSATAKSPAAKPATSAMSAARTSPAAASASDLDTHVNEVRLVGRLAGEPVLRELPSGDSVLAFRLVVHRGLQGARRDNSTRTPTVDTLDCAAWIEDVQGVVSRAVPGELLDVRGALRRRFWRASTGPVSRSEVEALRVTRVETR